MGAAAGAGGSDRSDEKKVDTYSQQLKTIQKKKSKTEKDRFGYTVPKKNSFVPPSVAIAKAIFKNPIDKLNLNRRMKFANKTGVNIQGLSTEEILSKDFKSKLDEKGYTRETPTGNNNGNDNNNQPVIVQKNVGGKTILVKEPTVEETKKTETEKKEYDARQTKKKGRTKNVLTSSKGVMKTAADYSLGKKSLLGQVV